MPKKSKYNDTSSKLNKKELRSAHTVLKGHLTQAENELKTTRAALRAQLTKIESKLEKSKAKAERWKTEAAAHRTAAARSGARVEKLQSKLDKANIALKPSAATSPVEAAATGRPPGDTTKDGVTVPDSTWTVAELRAEARARGLTGLSNKPKTQLLAALA